MPTPVRVLIVEDSEDDALLMARVLRQGAFEPVIERVDNAEDMKAALAGHAWDVVLADYSMPRFSMFDALRLLKAADPEVPFIVVSGTIGEEIAVAAMRGGVLDYIPKDEITRLVPAVERELREAAERRARRRAEMERDLVLRSAGEGICGVDREGLITFANPVAAETLGWAPEDLIGQPIHEVLPHSAPDGTVYARDECPACAAIRDGATYRAPDAPSWRKEGTRLSIEYVSTPMRQEDHLVGAVVIFKDISERKRVDEALRSQENLLRTVLQVLPVGVWLTDADGRIAMGNEAGRRIWGGARYVGLPEYGEYKGWWADSGRRIAADEWALARAVTRGDTSINEEIFIEAFDGARKTILNSAVPLRDPEGRIAGAIVVNQEITERKQAELALREERDFIAAVLDTVANLVVVLDRGGRLVRFNRACEELTGYSQKDVHGKPFWDLALVPADEAPGVRDVIEQLQAGLPNEYENHWITRDGRRRLIAWTNTVLRDEGGTVRYVIATGTDITERRRVEAAVRFQARLLDAVGQAVIATDLDGGITYWNRAAEALYGWRASEAVGRNILDMTPTPASREAAARVMAHVRAGESWSGELPVQTRDGITFPALVTDVPIKDERGRVTGVIGASIDIGERKRAEDAVRDARQLAQDAYEREHRIASRFQSALLPRGALRLPGYELAHTYRPASSEADVGGDFYNLFDIGGGRVGLVVGDVGGKGLEAAAVAAQVQHSIVALATEDRLPGAVLDVVRRVITAFDPERLVTVFFAVLEAKSGAIVCANAGHLPPMVWRAAAGSVEMLPTSGPAVFGIPLDPYESYHTLLQPDDLLLLYTDGLVEAHSPTGPDLLGEERVVEILQAGHDARTWDILDRLYAEAVNFSNGHLRDDIALLALRRTDAHPNRLATWVEPPQMESRIAVPG